jgi:hypothetical protein
MYSGSSGGRGAALAMYELNKRGRLRGGRGRWWRRGRVGRYDDEGVSRSWG